MKRKTIKFNDLPDDMLYEIIYTFRCLEHPDRPGEYKDSFRYYAIKRRKADG